MKKLLFTIFLSLITMSAFANRDSRNDTSMFPKAEKGKVQKVIKLDPKDNEEDYLVEIFVSKIAETDKCNQVNMIGAIKENNLQGWGYTYYTFGGSEMDGNIISTKMGCPDNITVKRPVFAPSIKARYNSKLPIIVYVPKGFDLYYRVWTAPSTKTIVK